MTSKLEMPSEDVPRFYADIINKMGGEIDALRAENERLQAALANADDTGPLLVRAGVEIAKESELLRTKNERLRAALERLKDYVAGQAKFVQTTQGWFPEDGFLALELEAAETALGRDNCQ